MDFWNRKRVFITGATGLLGSAVKRRLQDRGAFIVALMRDKVAYSALDYEGLTIVSGELLDPYLIERALNEYEIDTVFHLGAQTIVGVANTSPISTFESNIRGTWNLLEAVRGLSRIERIVVASSDKAYGESKDLPYTETHPLRGLHPYDCSKSCVDLIAQTYIHTYNLPIGITRCGNIYGGGDMNLNRLIPGTIVSLLVGERPIIRSDGCPKRDYICVEDAADAVILLAENLNRPEIKGEAFNFSTETPLTVLEITQKILQIMKKEDLPPMILAEARLEIEDQYLSCQKARERLSFKPKFSIDEGLERTVEWYKEHIDWFSR
ncbi:MAG: NAD-dependent epimerase/dehydratase family protein [Candidatus Desantisbacteria bacterium]